MSLRDKFKDRPKLKRHLAGMIHQGNIDLTKRSTVKNKDGSVSTVRSIVTQGEYDGKERTFVVPTVVDGKVVDNDSAVRHAFKSRQNLGEFDSVENASTYAEELHKLEEKRVKRGK